MASGGKTGARRKTTAVDLFADGRKIHLGVAPKAKIIIPRHKHFGVNRTMNLVTSRASFANGFVFKHKRAALLFVVIKAGFIDSF